MRLAVQDVENGTSDGFVVNVTSENYDMETDLMFPRKMGIRVANLE